jgi:hypothetical protein
MEVDELLAGNTGASDDINGSNTGEAIGAVVVDEYGVIHRHGPMREGLNFWPMEVSVKKHGASHHHDGLDGAFGDTVLVMSTNAGKALVLTVG